MVMVGGEKGWDAVACADIPANALLSSFKMGPGEVVNVVPGLDNWMKKHPDLNKVPNDVNKLLALYSVGNSRFCASCVPDLCCLPEQNIPADLGQMPLLFLLNGALRETCAHSV